jgi:hypothetical protein
MMASAHHDPRQAEIDATALAEKAKRLFDRAERLRETHRSDRATRAHLAKVQHERLKIEQVRSP